LGNLIQGGRKERIRKLEKDKKRIRKDKGRIRGG